jgi:hypothetical protein
MHTHQRIHSPFRGLQEATIDRVSDASEQWYVTGHGSQQQKRWQSQEASKWSSEASTVG